MVQQLLTRCRTEGSRRHIAPLNPVEAGRQQAWPGQCISGWRRTDRLIEP